VKVPGFLVVGAPKAGTSSLYQYLQEHPEIYLPKQKELHYWSSEALSENTLGPGDQAALPNVVTTWRDYCRRYEAATLEKQLGDVSPSYLYFYNRVIPELKRKLPAVKIIIILRDPIERACSNYLHQQRLTYETLSFTEALDCEVNRAAEGYSDFWRYTGHSCYFAACEAYVRAFGLANVHFITFEELRNSPADVMTNVFSFLGVDETCLPDNLDSAYNSGGRYKASLLMRFFMRPNRLKSYFHGRLSEKSIQAYRSLKLKFTAVRSLPIPEIPSELRAKLSRIFKDDVEALSANYNVNVKLWSRFDDK